MSKSSKSKLWLFNGKRVVDGNSCILSFPLGGLPEGVPLLLFEVELTNFFLVGVVSGVRDACMAISNAMSLGGEAGGYPLSIGEAFNLKLGEDCIGGIGTPSFLKLEPLEDACRTLKGTSPPSKLLVLCHELLRDKVDKEDIL
mmetsp:Transcript_32342/g.23888  ORF Transcript_32342/g.23888 Transcript_32342/m.23888 type:complete len:143 (+) Transcript_32342:232-660(+)